MNSSMIKYSHDLKANKELYQIASKMYQLYDSASDIYNIKQVELDKVVLQFKELACDLYTDDKYVDEAVVILSHTDYYDLQLVKTKLEQLELKNLTLQAERLAVLRVIKYGLLNSQKNVICQDIVVKCSCVIQNIIKILDFFISSKDRFDIEEDKDFTFESLSKYVDMGDDVQIIKTCLIDLILIFDLDITTDEVIRLLTSVFLILVYHSLYFNSNVDK